MSSNWKTNCQPCWCIYVSLAYWNSKNDRCCNLKGSLAVKSSVHLPFVRLPVDPYATVRNRSEQRRYEDTPVSTSSRSQAPIKLYCWHTPTIRHYNSYSKKNIFFLNIVLGEKSPQTQTESFQVKYSLRGFIKKAYIENGLNSAKITM